MTRKEDDLKQDGKISSWLADDGTFKTKDPYKDALLRTLGAERVDIDKSDPFNVIFVLRHDQIGALNKSLHMGHARPDGLLVAQYIKDNFELLREIKMNLKK